MGHLSPTPSTLFPNRAGYYVLLWNTRTTVATVANISLNAVFFFQIPQQVNSYIIIISYFLFDSSKASTMDGDKRRLFLDRMKANPLFKRTNTKPRYVSHKISIITIFGHKYLKSKSLYENLIFFMKKLNCVLTYGS